MGDGTKDRIVTTDQIFEYVKNRPEFRNYRDSNNLQKNAVWKANELTQEDPQHFIKLGRTQYQYKP